MSTLQNAGLTMCICCIAAAIISMLVPSGRTEKMLNLIIGVFLVAAIVAPIKDVIKNIKIDTSYIDSVDDVIDTNESGYEAEVIKTTADNLVLALNTLLEQENIKPQDIKINLSKGKEKSIFISKINIYINKEDKSKISRIKEITEENFKITPLVLAEN